MPDYSIERRDSVLSEYETLRHPFMDDLQERTRVIRGDVPLPHGIYHCQYCLSMYNEIERQREMFITQSEQGQ